MPSDDLRLLGNQGYALALGILRHRDDAADAVQDAMHQLFRKQESFDAGRGTLKAWFLKIVRNRCIDMQRKSRPSTATQQFDPVDSSESAPDQLTEKRELVASVRSALEAMPDAAREIIMLRDFHGLSYAEISEVLGVASGTVMSRLHRARQQLREKVLSQHD